MEGKNTGPIVAAGGPLDVKFACKCNKIYIWFDNIIVSVKY